MGGCALSPNAIGSVVPSFGGGGGGGASALSSALAALWQWNRIDLTQFDTGALLDFRQTTGLGPAGVVTPSYVANAFQGAAAIRLNADAAFIGGAVLPVSAAQLVLPARFLLECRIAAIGANLVAGVCPFGVADLTTASGSGWKGPVFRRAQGGTVAQHRRTPSDGGTNQQTLRRAGRPDRHPPARTRNTAPGDPKRSRRIFVLASPSPPAR